MVDEVLLKKGTRLQTETSRRELVVGDLLGGGGQGQVFAAALGSRTVALKWYKADYLQVDPELRDRLQRLVEIGPPSDAFLWPFELVSGRGAKGFGYVMPLKDPRFHDVVKVLMGKVTLSLGALATVAFNLVDAFLQIHAKGCCYRDINWNNCAVDAITGEVRIFDCDNIDVEGRPTGILGFPHFMAPEVMRREALPSRATDLHSLAVLLFLLLVRCHPLIGRRWEDLFTLKDADRFQQLLGIEPLFIFDPNDRSNAPNPHTGQRIALAYWPLCPTVLRERFTKAFTTGLRDPENGRVTEGLWRQTLALLRGAIFACRECGSDNFFDAKLRKVAPDPGRCWACGEPLILPPHVEVGKYTVMLDGDGSAIFPHHVDERRHYDYTKAVARVSAEKRGLVNLSESSWSIRAPGQSTREVKHEEVIPLVSGTSIHFGTSTGVLRC